MFTFGSIVYFLLSSGKNVENADVDITKFPLLAKQLIYACCSVQPECRPTFENICDVLEKNDFNLISLSQHEFQDIKKLIEQHKLLINSDSD